MIFGDVDEVKVFSKDVYLNDNSEAVVGDYGTELGVMAKDQPTVALRETV